MDKVLDRIATALEVIWQCLAGNVAAVPKGAFNAESATETATVAKAKSTRTKKAEPTPVAAEDLFEEPTAPAEVLPAKVITLAEVADVVRKLVGSDAKDGHSKATSVLAKFGAKRISEVKPEDFAAVIAKIDQLLKAK